MQSPPTLLSYLLLLRRRPPRPTLFPYTTLFRSLASHLPLAAALQPIKDGFQLLAAGTTDGADPGVLLSADNISRLRSEEHTSELQSQFHLVCRLLLEKKNNVQLHR